MFFRPKGIHWPPYKADNPIYYIFNAEGEEDMRANKYGRGPAATSCAFWNDFLPRLRNWGEIFAQQCLTLSEISFIYSAAPLILIFF